MENVKEIKELLKEDEVNEYLNNGWKLISINTHYPTYVARSSNSTPSKLVYVVGR